MKKVIFDCDNTMGLPFKEVDDGLALLYLLGRPDIELIGVTTTFGNGTAGQACTQTKKLLQRAGRPEIPVILGAARRHDSPTPAAHFLAETAAAHPGEISLLATGPLGNLSAAASLYPAFLGNLKQIACMGGYLSPLRLGHRNLPELNLSSDPEAAHLVLAPAPTIHCSPFTVHCSPPPVTLMTAQVCLQARFDRSDIDSLTFWPTKTRRVLRRWLWAFGLYCGISEFYLWDLLPAVYLFHPELFDIEQVNIASCVEDLECGKLVVSRDDPVKQVTMPSKILDIGRFRSVLFEAWEQVVLRS